MIHARLPLGRLCLLLQCAILPVGLAIAYAAPPREGRLLLLPITDGARHLVAAHAVASGARLVAAGPWRGSLLVDGVRDRLAAPMLAIGVLPVAARIAGCGGAKR